MSNEKLSLANWIAGAEAAHESFADYVAKVAAAEMETADIAQLDAWAEGIFDAPSLQALLDPK